MEPLPNPFPSIWRSAKPFDIDRVDADTKKDILKVATYPYTEFDSATITFNDGLKAAFSTCMLWSPQQPDSAAYASIGHLERMPNEVVSNILCNLDIKSLWNFKHVNRRAWEYVLSLPEYRLIVMKAPEILMALFGLKTPGRFTLVDVMNALQPQRSVRCENSKERDGRFCDKMGAFVFIPTLQRCCLRCLETSPDFLVYVHKDTHRWRPWRFTPQWNIQTIPGKYGRAVHGKNRRLQANYRARQWLVHYDSYSGEHHDCNMSQNRQKEEYRYMSAIRLGLLDPRSSLSPADAKLSPGVCCAGCRDIPLSPLPTSWTPGDILDFKNRVYSEFDTLEQPYLDHFKWCRNAQRLWNKSQTNEAQGITPACT
ncbi:hypothetical protein B0T21DRAFT_428089 [Apiosordaria backusii]|uniref:F-box domain-containing protein n=1 Tax=Apiosordaria backusii TaxID=314023 RepID=A0AA40DM70_9PEZI|nr:hypothetical protein B0T21DRAFT_428089 [Apiosordaria backusii]